MGPGGERMMWTCATFNKRVSFFPIFQTMIGYFLLVVQDVCGVDVSLWCCLERKEIGSVMFEDRMFLMLLFHFLLDEEPWHARYSPCKAVRAGCHFGLAGPWLKGLWRKCFFCFFLRRAAVVGKKASPFYFAAANLLYCIAECKHSQRFVICRCIYWQEAGHLLRRRTWEEAPNTLVRVSLDIALACG